ncbi:MAG: hypothetical protein WA066_02925 [Candidatus Omnitrophota bacterium]
MVKTKFVLLKVICEGCEMDLPFFGIQNYDKLPCDICGQIRARVTFSEA